MYSDQKNSMPLSLVIVKTLQSKESPENWKFQTDLLNGGMTFKIKMFVL